MVNKTHKYTEKCEVLYGDVKSSDWFYDEVWIAVKAGYITTWNLTFRHINPISKEKVAVIVTTIMKNKDEGFHRMLICKDK